MAGARRGVWNVAHVSSCYLVSGHVIHGEDTSPSYVHQTRDPDTAFTESLRDRGVFLFVSNRHDFGHLVNNEAFPTTNLHNELWEVQRNRYDWERRWVMSKHDQNSH